ncbi:SWIM zinc finger family protein [Nonomuraea sp. KM90]|uniref:SWIM zinc finger family protein n=1 Tax=Nonomuraea sp. KM90 TaxID=3457428 RepID=UPI003FCE1F58
MTERWSRDQVLALAPDAPSQKAAQGVAAPGKWSLRGTTGTVLYGECKGSGAKPYLACVDLTEPAYRCSCPSRKFPCKHALGLLLLWSADAVPVQEAAPQWVTEWLEGRAERAEKSAARLEAARVKAAEAAALEAGDAARAGGAEAGDAGPGDAAGRATLGETGAPGPDTSGTDPSDLGALGAEGPGPGVPGRGVGPGTAIGANGTSAGGRGESVRHSRVAAGLAELERWLADQVRQGLAGAAEHDWDGLAKRLIDAQAPGVAGVVSRLSRVRAEEGWPGRLLEEYALINLLAIAYRRRAELPKPLAQTVLIRAGFPVTREEVLAGPPVRDHWDVLGRRDEAQDRLTARRVWLRGRRTGRPALILSFAPQGQPLDASLVTGTTIDADLTFYPGAAPLRALVATRHGTAPWPPPTPDPSPPADSPAAPSPAAPSRAVGSQGAPSPGAAPPEGQAATGLPPTSALPPAAQVPAMPGGVASPAASASEGRGAGAGSAPVASSPEGRVAAGLPSVVQAPAVPRAVPPGVSPEEGLDEVARALAEDPWTESWPLVLAGVVPDRTSVGGLPLHPRCQDPWRLIAVSGGHPVTVAVEWTPQGVRPLTTWDDEGTAVIL